MRVGAFRQRSIGVWILCKEVPLLTGIVPHQPIKCDAGVATMCAGLNFAPCRRHVAPARTWEAAGVVDIRIIQRGQQQGRYIKTEKRGGHGPCVGSTHRTILLFFVRASLPVLNFVALDSLCRSASLLSRLLLLLQPLLCLEFSQVHLDHL